VGKRDDDVDLTLDPDAARKNRGRPGDLSGKDLLQMSNDEIRHIRGAQISMVFQDP